MSLSDKASNIRLVALDVDGVLTDGRIGYGAGPDEVKFFDVKDGLGIVEMRRAGLKVGIISGRGSRANRRRAEELGLDFICENERDKTAAFQRVLAEFGFDADACLYMGDDVVDIPVLRAAGVGVAVADAVAEARAAADWCTVARGGCGAVREVAEWILGERGLWAAVVERYS